MADILMAFMPVVAFLAGGLGTVGFMAIARKLAPAPSTPEQPEGGNRG